MDSDLQYKAEIERLRNKQRQREQLFSAQPFTLAASTNNRNSNRAWKHQQHKIDAVLDPVTSMDESGKYVPAEEYLVPCQTPMMKCFAKIGNSWKLLSVFVTKLYNRYLTGSKILFCVGLIFNATKCFLLWYFLNVMKCEALKTSIKRYFF